ncbi:MAG: hypothetical protein AMJ95_06355 [Omnitrophica WOR_2 bacterium SM23_72]|nr:MAG: hypothetical protein AMJ95_06355 [Omnitrophica WOR_2 bacterium SM23_72]
MKKNKLKIPLKKIRLLAILLVALTLMGFGVWKFLQTLDQFKIAEIRTSNDTPPFDFSYLKGRNILELDLKRESAKILQFFPECKRVRMVRILPNRIYIDLVQRKAIALVKLYKYFGLDADLVLFDVSVGEDVMNLGLPVITGMDTKIFGPKVGRKYDIKELRIVLSIIEEARRNRVLRDCKIRKIDIPQLTHISIFIIPGPSDSDYMDSTLRNEGLEIKLSSDRVRFKVALLAKLMVAAKKEWNKIKYIDLRFREPVIKLKDTKE